MSAPFVEVVAAAPAVVVVGVAVGVAMAARGDRPAEWNQKSIQRPSSARRPLAARPPAQVAATSDRKGPPCVLYGRFAL